MVSGAVFAAGKIGKIEFVQLGNYSFPEDMLRFNVQQKPGDAFDQKLLNDDIKRLYDTGFFIDVVAETKAGADGDSDVVFKLKAKPVVKRIVCEGNKKFPTDELEKVITLQIEQPMNDKKLRASANALRKLYRDKGYNEATIAPLVKSSGEGVVDVVFKIDEKLRYKVNNVTFTGNTVFTNWTLKDSIATRHSFLSRYFEFGLYDPRELELDKVRLRELYWNKGYLDFKVEDAVVSPEKSDPEYVDVEFKLFEGKPYHVNKVSIVGNKKLTDDQLLPLLSPLRKGEIYDNVLAKKAKESIEYEYAAMGYADFQCVILRHPDFETHNVDLEFKITEGIPYTVHDVNIKGNKVTKDKVIRRELAVQPGDPVDKTRIEASKSRIMGMGYFKDVKAVTVNADEYGTKNVDFSVEEKNNFEFKIGGGFSDTDSLVGMLSLTNNNFDITDPERWFQGGGQRLRAQAMFGLDRYDFNLDFTEPWLFDIPLRLDVGAYVNNVSYEDWDERRIGGKASLNKRVFDDFTHVIAGYKFEQVRVHNMKSGMSEEMNDQKGDKLVSTASLELLRDTRDSLTDPSIGYEASLMGAISPKVLGCSDNYYRNEAKFSYYYNFFDKAIIAHLGAKAGVLGMFNRDNDAPIFERYFLGGGNSLRGFAYRNVSPVDDNDKNIGGMSMLLLTGEVTHPIWKFIRGAVFVDAGNVWKNSWSANFAEMNVGIGYGLRMRLPWINAPVQLDLAYPIVCNQSGMSKKLRFHFNMGFTW